MNRSPSSHFLMGLSLLLAVAARLCWAGSIEGRVLVSGTPAPRAFVVTHTGLLIQTDAAGHFRFDSLPEGPYALRAFARGQQPATQTAHLRRPDAQATVTFDLQPGGPEGLLLGEVRDQEGKPLPSRIVVRLADGRSVPAFDAAGRDYRLSPALSRRLVDTPEADCFWCQGRFAVAVPAGKVLLNVSHGFVYEPAQREVTVSATETTVAAITLERPLELSSMGWVAGDALFRLSRDPNPAAGDLAFGAAVCRAEGLDWAFVPGLSVEEGDRLCQAVSDARFSCWPGRTVAAGWGGELVALGPRRALDLPTGGPSLEAMRHAADRGGLALFTHLFRQAAGPELPVPGSPSALGLPAELPFDALAGPDLVRALDLQTDSLDGAAEQQLWYLLLNAGAEAPEPGASLAEYRRLAAASFTDSVLDQGEPPLSNRTYVRLKPPLDPAGRLTPEPIIAGLREGATFVSSGPIVQFRVDQAWPGEELEADGKYHQARALVLMPAPLGARLDEVQVIRCGRILQRYDLREHTGTDFRRRFSIRETGKAWFVLKAYGSLRGDPATAQVAWTSPIYFRAPGQRPRAKEPPAGLTVRVSGRVSEAETNQPVPGAQVQVVESGRVTQTLRTDAGGRYSCTAPASAAFRVVARGHAARDNPLSADPEARRSNTTKYLAWDVPEVRRELWPTSRAALLDPARYQRLRDLLREVVLDFPLRD
jgi:hypothetical protein